MQVHHPKQKLLKTLAHPITKCHAFVFKPGDTGVHMGRTPCISCSNFKSTNHLQCTNSYAPNPAFVKCEFELNDTSEKDDKHASTLEIRTLLNHQKIEPWASDIDRPLKLNKLTEYLLEHGRKIPRKPKLKVTKNLQEMEGSQTKDSTVIRLSSGLRDHRRWQGPFLLR